MGFSNEAVKPMTENRFLRSLFTITASSVLVGGGLLLLTSTAPWTRPPQSDPSTPDSMPLAAEPTIEFPQTEIDQARTSISNDAEVDDTITASTGEEPSLAESEAAQSTEAASADPDVVAASDTPVEAATDDSSEDDGTSEGMAVADTLPEPDSVATNEAPDGDTAALPEPQPSIAEDKTNAATDQTAALLTDLPPRAIASDQSSAATGEVATVLAATPPAPAATEARPEVAVMTPPPPMPARKPEDAPAAPKAVAVAAPPLEKPSRPEEPKAAPPQAVARQEPAQPASKSQWQPMALAPADKPAVSVPTARPSGPAYASKVWSALARHKPRAGQSGSTTVSFAIGENGALRGLKVGRSSGNARIDQLALATVRGAAPFPPPPSGSASYSIRIDFH